MTSRSFLSILKENLLTLFNIMLAIVAIMVLSTGSFADCLFVIVIVVNSLIGIMTELRAKRELDKLSILIQSNFKVIRGETELNLVSEEIEENDEIVLKAGDQIPIDGKVISGFCEVDESMLTGESRSVQKSENDEIFAGTTVTAGEIRALVQKTPQNSKAASLTKQAKVFKLASSDLRDAINKILKLISFGIVPVALLLILTQIQIGQSLNQSILQAASGIVGMIPEGLVLLTSVNFAISAIILAKKQVLVSELNSVETLAKVNVLLLDKTGTITDGEVEVNEIIEVSNRNCVQELFALSILRGGTKTTDAISKHLKSVHKLSEKVEPEIIKTTPFSSKWKFSSIETKEGVFKLGAPEVVAKEMDLTKWTEKGLRVLVLTLNDAPQLIIVCEEHIRQNAAKIIALFQKSGVEVRIISGDNQKTVESIAQKVGIRKELVIGRALPETKLNLVNLLQKEGKVIAMTGDGVNDMLALKQADLGIAMGNAAPASKAVANLVLLDGDFAALPSVISQGRRVIANIERVASLFLVKTFYSISLTFLTIILSTNYPFLPRHLTLISALTIGIPAFFLALPKNETPYTKGFLKRVLKFSLPFGILAALLVELSIHLFPQSSPTIQMATLFFITFIVLAIKSRPLLSWRGIMLIILITITVLSFMIVPISSFFML